MDPNSSNQNNPSAGVVPPNPVTPAGSIPPQPPPVQTPPPLPPNPVIPPSPIDPDYHVFAPHASTPPPPEKKPIDKKIIAIIIGILILVTIPIVAFFVLNQPKQVTPTKVEVKTIDPNTLVANFNGEKIYYKDLVAIAKEQYAESAIDSQALKDALNILTERKILDAEKVEKNIDVTEEEIKEKQDIDGVTHTQGYYEVLRDKTTKIEAKSWEVFVIGFWVPPSNAQSDLTEEEKATVKVQLEEGLKALDEAEVLMKTDQSAIDIASTLVAKYQALGSILGVNGYLLNQAKESGDLTELTNPKVYTFEPGNAGQPLFDTIYALKTPGEVQKVISDEESGGNVVKLVSVNSDTSFDSYDAWLTDKRKTLLQIVYSL